jgi:hypothetical protein
MLWGKYVVEIDQDCVFVSNLALMKTEAEYRFIDSFEYSAIAHRR